MFSTSNIFIILTAITESSIKNFPSASTTTEQNNESTIEPNNDSTPGHDTTQTIEPTNDSTITTQTIEPTNDSTAYLNRQRQLYGMLCLYALFLHVAFNSVLTPFILF